ncbi:hypothetical protein GCM10028807_17330 [Spirosoma daeguense]
MLIEILALIKQVMSYSFTSILKKTLVLNLLIPIIILGCKSSDSVNPLSKEDDLETNGSILDYLAGVYILENVYSNQTLVSEQAPLGADPPFSTIKSTYTLVMTRKGSDSLLVLIQGDGILGELPSRGSAYSPRLITTSASKDSIIMENKRSSKWAVSRIKESNKTRYRTDQFYLAQGQNRIGHFNFIKVSSGVVRN